MTLTLAEANTIVAASIAKARQPWPSQRVKNTACSAGRILPQIAYSPLRKYLIPSVSQVDEFRISLLRNSKPPNNPRRNHACF